MEYKILLIGNIYDETTPFVQDFIKRGYEVKFLRLEMFPRKQYYLRLKNFLGLGGIRSSVGNRKAKLESEILSIVKEFQPEMVFDTNAMFLNAHCADEIRKHSFLVAKMLDRTIFFPGYYEESFSKHYDVIYTYSLDDYNAINSISENCVYIPALFEANYFHFDERNRDIDISFVGSLYPKKDYGQRYELLCRLVSEFPQLNIFVGGKCAPIRRPIKFFRWISHPLYRKAFNNKQISTIECNNIYNRSKIGISIERNGTGNSWSSRLVNLFVTKTFVLSADNSEVMRKYFDGCYVYFTDYMDLKKKIQYYLRHSTEREEIAKRAYEKVISLANDPNTINLSDDVVKRLCFAGLKKQELVSIR